MAGEEGQVIRCQTYDEWTFQLDKAKGSNKMIVIEFTASDCGDCQEIAPFIADLAKKFKSTIIFLEVDCFELKSVAKEYDVKAYPTFVSMLGNGLEDKLHSSDKKKIEGTIDIFQKLHEAISISDDDLFKIEGLLSFLEENEKEEEGQVIRCGTYDEWTVQLNKARESNKKIVIEFTASDCPRCKEIAPFIAGLANKFKSKAIILEVDGSELESVAKEYDVSVYPTFVLMEGGVVKDTLPISDKKEIKRTIDDLEKLGCFGIV